MSFYLSKRRRLIELAVGINLLSHGGNVVETLCNLGEYKKSFLDQPDKDKKK